MHYRKTISISVLCLLLAGTVTGGILLNVDVGEQVDGTVEYLQVRGTFPQQVYMSWYNAGSVACPAQAKLEFFNGTTPVYTAWSERTKLQPGNSADWNIVVPLPEGKYTYRITVQHCFDQKTFTNGTILSTGASHQSQHMTVEGASATESSLTLYLRANTSINETHIIPTQYPAGWRIPTQTISSLHSGEIARVTVPYRPGIWEEKNITFTFAANEGVSGTATVSTRKQRPLQEQVELLLLRLQYSLFRFL